MEESNAQSALDEAQQLMNQLDTGDDLGAAGVNDEPIAFSIDSDDEEDEDDDAEGISPKKPTDSHPLLDNGDETPHHPLAAGPPSSSQQQQQPNSSFSSSATMMHNNFAGNAGQQPQTPHHPLAATATMSSTNPGTVPLSTTSASSASLQDSWKQQTSRFASAMATMAQRAASQVAHVTSTTQHPTAMAHGHNSNNSNNMMNPHPSQYHSYMGFAPPQQHQQQLQQQQQAPLSGSSVGSAASFSGSGPGDPGKAVMPNNYNNGMMPFATELDNEQKDALVRTHVGELLPGERIIMFVANLLHVSDSSGFNYTYSPAMKLPSNGDGGSSSSSSAASSNAAIWCCAMTYYRLILFGTHPFSPPPRPADWNPTCWPHRPVHLLQMPLAAMERVERTVFSAPTMSGGGGAGGGNASNTLSTTSLMGLHIVGKDNGRTLRFTTPSYADTVRAHEALQNYAFPGSRNLGYLFAFESKKEAVMKSIVTDPATGQKKVTLPPCARQFEPLAEFNRQFQRFGSSHQNRFPWMIYQAVNVHYQLCPSYPSILVGPASLNENNPDSVRVLQQSAAFRSEQRLPVLTYASGRGGGSLWRASQPKIGLQGNRSPADEWLLKQILDQAVQANSVEPPQTTTIPRQVLLQLTGSASLEQLANHWLPSFSSSPGSTLASGSSLILPCEMKILDLRPRSSAMANRTGGYGYENTSNYPGSTLTFCGIGNIHAVRDSYQKISSICLSPATPDLSWNSQIEDTKWLHHIRNILAASWEAAYWIHVFSLPVVLHCSHGWDRTSQVACLAQLLLDPYYRTIPGFACLVEKDFMSFGHPFHTRCAHGVATGSSGTSSAPNAAVTAAAKNDNFDEGQISPVFLQFLDCVYQLVSLYPDAFEITTRYLLDLSDHIYSCRFGSFLCDTERERETVAGILQRTHSVWEFLECRHAGGTNDGGARRKEVAASGVLLMPLPTLLRNVHLWTDRHAKYGAKPTQRWLSPAQAETASFSMTTTSSQTGSSSLSEDGRHDDDTPQFYRIPTFHESQNQILSSVAAAPSLQQNQPQNRELLAKRNSSVSSDTNLDTVSIDDGN